MEVWTSHTVWGDGQPWLLLPRPNPRSWARLQEVLEVLVSVECTSGVGPHHDTARPILTSPLPHTIPHACPPTIPHSFAAVTHTLVRRPPPTCSRLTASSSRSTLPTPHFLTLYPPHLSAGLPQPARGRPHHHPDQHREHALDLRHDRSEEQAHRLLQLDGGEEEEGGGGEGGGVTVGGGGFVRPEPSFDCACRTTGWAVLTAHSNALLTP